MVARWGLLLALLLLVLWVGGADGVYHQDLSLGPVIGTVPSLLTYLLATLRRLNGTATA